MSSLVHFPRPRPVKASLSSPTLDELYALVAAFYAERSARDRTRLATLLRSHLAQPRRSVKRGG
jgi:hypothetical protein